MNKSIRFVLIFILIISCKRDVTKSDCITLSQNSDWIKSDFKNNYTIQFPPDYSGEGKTGFEGNIFYKIRNDSSVVFTYAYCSPVFCTDFGDSLFQPSPNSVNIKINDSMVTLNQKINFCNSNMQTAILYYNNSNNAYARLYWKDGEIYKQALEISYKYARQQEVLDIIKTIQRK